MLDLPYDFSAPVVIDLTESRFEEGEPLYRKVLKESDARRDASADLSEEDATYEAFCRQSGMADMLGRAPASVAADFAGSDGGKPVEASAAGMSDGEAWAQFVELTGFEDASPAAGGTADLSEGDADDGQPQMSDDEMWARYQAALGQS